METTKSYEDGRLAMCKRRDPGIDLSLFVRLPDDPLYYYDLIRPCFIGGIWYATDGVIIVRVKPDHLKKLPNEQSLNFPDALDQPWRCHRRLIDLPRRLRPIKAITSYHNYYRLSDVVVLDGVAIDAAYYDKLKKLPKCRVSRHTKLRPSSHTGGGLYFSFEGGNGLLMEVVCDNRWVSRRTWKRRRIREAGNG